MCDLKGPFKLCTCSDKIDKKKPHWILERISVNLKDLELTTIIGIFSSTYLMNIDDIIEQLNTTNTFDFDYTPKQKDILILDFVDDYYELIYTKGKWREFFDYGALDKDQKINFKSGEIELLKSN